MSVQRPSESLENYCSKINITRKEELCLEAKNKEGTFVTGLC